MNSNSLLPNLQDIFETYYYSDNTKFSTLLKASTNDCSVRVKVRFNNSTSNNNTQDNLIVPTVLEEDNSVTISNNSLTSTLEEDSIPLTLVSEEDNSPSANDDSRNGSIA